MTLLASFYAGSLVTSLSTREYKSIKTIIYSTIYGAIHSLYAVSSENFEILSAVESLLLEMNISIVGRNVNHFRNTFIPSIVFIAFLL